MGEDEGIIAMTAGFGEFCEPLTKFEVWNNA